MSPRLDQFSVNKCHLAKCFADHQFCEVELDIVPRIPLFYCIFDWHFFSVATSAGGRDLLLTPYFSRLRRLSDIFIKIPKFSI